jgi:hypothetical protein
VGSSAWCRGADGGRGSSQSIRDLGGDKPHYSSNADSLYVIGGHDANGLTPGTWRHQCLLQAWTQLSPSGAPSAGAHFASTVDDFCGVLFLAGSDHDDGIDVNTTDVFSFSRLSFLRLATTADFSPPRRHSVLVLEPQSRTLMLFGGFQDPSHLLADTRVYQLGSSCPL